MGQTIVEISGEDFLVNGAPTYEGQTFNGHRIEGLLMNSRMVQAIYDDLNPKTRSRWNYPDTPWDPDRNTTEFVAMLPTYKAHGLVGVTINLQGGSPEGYSETQPWINSAFDEVGTLRPKYMERLGRILAETDRLNMVVILGFFYFGQDERLKDELAVKTAVDTATDWVVNSGYQHVLIEVANEVDVPRYEHEIIQPARCHELIARVQVRSKGRLLAGTSFAGGSVPTDAVMEVSDFLLLHGNGVSEPDGIRAQVLKVRSSPSYKGQPIVYNEDDHFNFHQSDNNMLAAIEQHAGWGFFDYRMQGEGFDQGYQNPPVNWSISSERKRGFFELLKKVTSRNP